MTTQGPSLLPPTTIQSTTPISQSAAHDFLTAYLDRASTDPALQPNASITEHGPVSRTTAAAPNLTLHNLKRVQAGLAGEILGRDLTFAKPPGLEGENNLGQSSEQQQAGINNWEDKQKWQQEDTGDDNNVLDDGDDDNATREQVMDVDDEAEGPAAAAAEDDGIDKEERKRRKKERRLQEKRAKSNKNNTVEEDD